MPLFIEGRRVPPRWAEIKSHQQAILIDSYLRQAEAIQIALVNNMPDAALEDTEMQFLKLLDGTSGDTPLRLSLYSLPGISRGKRGEDHLRSFYTDFNDLWGRRLDAVIVTGTEPCSTNLREEPYWPALVNLLDWAERNTISAVFSCLAAHASALHSDGITRNRLREKRFGVFEFNKVSGHHLTRGTSKVRFPHSRWNEIQATALTDCGYLLLTESADAGVDTFVKTKNNSLFVHFQGHPEYDASTLLKEYRRDIKRFVRGERETYPSLPQGYFDAKATKLLMDFQRVALSDRREELMMAFPETEVVGGLQNGWHACARTIYRNWLTYMTSRKLQASTFVALSSSTRAIYRKRSAMQ